MLYARGFRGIFMKKSWLKKYLNYLEVVKQASDHTIRNYSIDLKAFEDFVGGKEVTSDTIRAFLAKLYSDGKKKASIARTLSSIKSFYRFLKKYHGVKNNPAFFLQTPKRERKIPVVLEIEEIKEFLEAPNSQSYLGLRDRAIIELFYSSGIRISELAGLDKSDLDFSQKMIKVFGKGRKERIVPMTKRAASMISSYLKSGQRMIDGEKHLKEFDKKAVFLNRFGERLSTRSINRMFEYYQKKSGVVKKVTPHTLRHSIATHLLDKGMDLRYIQEMLGHTTIATTTIYTKVSAELKKKSYQKFHPLENI